MWCGADHSVPAGLGLTSVMPWMTNVRPGPLVDINSLLAFNAQQITTKGNTGLLSALSCSSSATAGGRRLEGEKIPAEQSQTGCSLVADSAVMDEQTESAGGGRPQLNINVS